MAVNARVFQPVWHHGPGHGCRRGGGARTVSVIEVAIGSKLATASHDKTVRLRDIR